MSERRCVRQRKPELMLQAALNDAEALGRVTPTPETVEQMRLLKVRLLVLKSRVNRKLQNEVAELTRRVEELTAENLRLHQEAARLRTACGVETGVTFDEIAMRGQNGR
jgi:FtsZ-binding cell division protein ZapB